MSFYEDWEAEADARKLDKARSAGENKMKLESINFGFENCEYAEVPMEHVHSFSLSDISRMVLFYAYQDDVKEYDVIGSMYINFKPSFVTYEAETNMEKELVIDRISKYSDICWFGMKYSDGTEKVYSVRWTDGSDDWENKGQKFGPGGIVGGWLLSINCPWEEE